MFCITRTWLYCTRIQITVWFRYFLSQIWFSGTVNLCQFFSTYSWAETHIFRSWFTFTKDFLLQEFIIFLNRECILLLASYISWMTFMIYWYVKAYAIFYISYVSQLSFKASNRLWALKGFLLSLTQVNLKSLLQISALWQKIIIRFYVLVYM